MANETNEQKIARLERENAALTKQNAELSVKKSNNLHLKTSEKGGLSLYGLGRFPTTLYKEQWIRLLDHSDTIRAYIKDHDKELKAKGE